MRSTEALVLVCRWCKVDIGDGGSARTPMEGWNEGHPVGWMVCGPECPKRPEGVRVYKAKVRDW